MGSPEVAAAWERLSAAVVQEFVYDSWWAYISPDREFPAEVRRLLRRAFGDVARRARDPRVDWGGVLISDCSRAICDVVTRHRRAVQLAGGRDALRLLTPSARDAAVRSALTSLGGGGGLHPAFASPDGHYRALRNLADGVASVLLTQQERACPLVLHLMRELFASCVLKSSLWLFMPASINRLIVQSWPEELTLGGRLPPTGAGAGGCSGGDASARLSSGAPAAGAGEVAAAATAVGGKQPAGDRGKVAAAAAAVASAAAAAAAGAAAFEARAARSAEAEVATAALRRQAPRTTHPRGRHHPQAAASPSPQPPTPDAPRWGGAGPPRQGVLRAGSQPLPAGAVSSLSEPEAESPQRRRPGGALTWSTAVDRQQQGQQQHDDDPVEVGSTFTSPASTSGFGGGSSSASSAAAPAPRPDSQTGELQQLLGPAAGAAAVAVVWGRQERRLGGHRRSGSDPAM